ncbi:MAG: spore maturation protein [Bacillota bacterium]|jgi:spore maturation protein B
MLEIFAVFSAYAIPVLLIFTVIFAWLKQVPLFETFVEGAKEGVGLMVRILPFLLGMLVAISIFRASGAFERLTAVLSPVAAFLHIPPDVIPLGLMRPLSGSGALGMTADILQTFGPDSYIGRVASVMQGSTDTTFYILTVYFGAVGISRYRHALICGLAADFTAFLAANFLCLLVFGG